LVVFHAQRFTMPPYFTPGQIAELTRQHRAEQDRAKQFLRLHVVKTLGAQASDLKMKFDLVDAHPVDAVLDAAKRHQADLIIMGTHGRGGAKRLWLGSVVENVVRQAGVPVFIVRQKQHEFIDPSGPQTVPQLGTILCPVNSSPAARRSLQHAASLAQQFKARLVTACILEPRDSRGLAEAKEELSSWLGQTAATQCELRAVARKGHAGARALANEPSLILADEPTAALDSQRGRQVMELFAKVAHERGAAVLVVTHDHRSLDVFDTTYEMEDGLLKQSG
jgi:nucleotide-binding universal stress UspA family protein